MSADAARTPTAPAQAARYPLLYQLNTRVRLTELARALGRPATLDDIGDAELDRWAALGFDWIWLLSVWQTGPAGQRVSRSEPAWRHEFERVLPDLQDEDIGGSGFAVRAYQVHVALGGDAALARLRERMAARGLRLMLDFVPNHVALDHPWVEAFPEFFVQGSAAQLEAEPQNWCRLRTRGGSLILAHGRDPYFDGWPDTLQLNYGRAQLQQAMIDELQRIAGQCDGLRCDMAMLVLPEVFERTWGLAMQPFWPKALAAVRHRRPGFRFMAEVYWDLEWTLQQQGFDHTYDKRLYDRLCSGPARPVREHLMATPEYQDRMARFLENHDEPRAASTFAPEAHGAAALIAYTTPGLRLFHQGQLEGFRARIPPHLVRGPEEPVDPQRARAYARLLAALREPALRDGDWALLNCRSAWDGNATLDQWIAWSWTGAGERWFCAATNYAPQPGQCYVPLPWPGLAGRRWRLRDLLSDAVYDRDGDELLQRGLYLDLPAWGHHLFALEQVPEQVQFSRQATLRDGTPVLIRAARPDDRQRIIDAFHQLDPETVYTRFFSAKRSLSETDLQRLERNDYAHQVALVATLERGGDEIIIGGGAYLVLQRPEPPLTAEMSFTIEEDYQGQGLSTLFMQLLTEIGRQRGIQRFEAQVLAGNDGMLKVFRRSGLPMREHLDDGVVFVEMDLAATAGG